MKNIKIIAIILALGSMQSCNLVELDETTDEAKVPVIVGPNTVPQTESVFMDYLHGETERSWTANGFTIFGINGFQDCRLDDTIILRADGTFTYNGGSTLCGAEDSQTVVNGSWEKTPDESSVVFVQGNNQYTATVTGLNDSLVVLSGRYIGLDINGVYSIN